MAAYTTFSTRTKTLTSLWPWQASTYIPGKRPPWRRTAPPTDSLLAWRGHGRWHGLRNLSLLAFLHLSAHGSHQDPRHAFTLSRRQAGGFQGVAARIHARRSCWQVGRRCSANPLLAYRVGGLVLAVSVSERGARCKPAVPVMILQA